MWVRFAACLLVPRGSGSRQCVFIHHDGATDPRDYEVPPGTAVDLQMLIRQKELAEEIEGNQFVFR